MAFSDQNSLDNQRPASKAFTITASDTVAIGQPCRGIMVTTAGAYTILLESSDTAIAMTLIAGVIYPMLVKRVNSTSAASTTGIIGFN